MTSRLLCVVLAAGVAGCAVSAAQQRQAPEATERPPFLKMPRPGNLGCPVVFSVARVAGLVLRSVERADPNAPPPQGVEVRFRSQDSARMVKVTAVVHGTVGISGYLPLAGRVDRRRTETFELTQSEGGERIGVRELWAKTLSAISSVTLEEIGFADGTVWRTSPGARCSASPSPFLLVSGQ